jgi:hypothetical protein
VRRLCAAAHGRVSGRGLTLKGQRSSWRVHGT